LLFALALQRAGCRFAFAPDALIHFRPRSSPGAFARQYFLYARGDGVADLWLRRHLLRYLTYGCAGLLLGAARRRPWLLGLLGLGAGAYCRAPLRRLRARAPALTPRELAAAAVLIPAIRLIGDVAKMVGYPVGVLRRLRSRELRQEIAEYTMLAKNAKHQT
jgi:hypothetical protein